MCEPELGQAGDGGAVALDDAAHQRVRTAHADLLADDRADAGLERVPRAGQAQAGRRFDQRAQDGVVREPGGDGVEVAVEVEDAPGTLHHVDQALPVRQVRAQEEMVVAAG